MENQYQKIICFLDILGFKEFIKNNKDHHIIIKEIFNKIDNALFLLRDQFKEWNAELEYSWISDTLVISGLIKDEPISRVNLEKILNFENEQKNVSLLYGKGLIECHVQESKK